MSKNREMKTMDGNSAAAYVSYAFTEVAAIYPITPSTPMADETDKMSFADKKNIFGSNVRVTEMQSEAGVAGAVHGSLAAGALTTTYTASQGLLLMIPVLYKLAGELLPCVIHTAARTVAAHALSIFGDHSDIYACRQTGAAMLCANNPQEVMDLAAVAHLASIKGRVPFIHFFDGFRTSHEIQKIGVWNYDDLAEMVDMDAVDSFRRRALNPEHPVIRGTAQNDDVYFQAREASNSYYDELPKIVVEYMNKVNEKLGTDYKPFNYYGSPDAERVIIAMGSVCDCAEEVIDYLIDKGEKVGIIKVHLYRPFCADCFLSALPKTVNSISVLDRTKEAGAVGEPLFLDVCAVLKDSEFCSVPVYSGRYGLASKDTTPSDIIAVYRNMQAETPKKRFTIGIIDDVTHLSLNITEEPDTSPVGTHSCKFWGLGADGTVGANKNSIKIIGDHTDMYAQGYFAYDSKKSGGLTVSHLRFGKKPIKSTYYIRQADFVACHNPSYVNKYEMADDLKVGGSFLLNCPWNEKELDEKLPGRMKRILAERNINFYTIDGIAIGKDIGLGGRINTILQSAFFKIADIIPSEQAKEYMKAAAQRSYGKKGQKIVDMNFAAIDRGMSEFHKVEIPAEWANAEDDSKSYEAVGNREELVRYVNEIQHPVNSYKGDKLPVSAFLPHADGTAPSGSAAYEKRGIAVDVPQWIPENCIQCNICSYVCPHAVVRPIVMTEKELDNAPQGTQSLKLTGMPELNFAVTVSTLDCTGCGVCAQMCPGKKGEKALVMKPIETQKESQQTFNYGLDLPVKDEVLQKFKETTVKGSQFKQPLLEFSGACAGCGETPYARLVTQLFGERMFIANATGCSSIWGASSPATPYTVSKNGRGPAWQNSLFEDNAEFGYGFALAQNAARARLKSYIEKVQTLTADTALQTACGEFIEKFDNGNESKEVSERLTAALRNNSESNDELKNLTDLILKDSDMLAKKSVWIFGGDGWAYDIGYGGLDHVVASGENINILIFDTEVYSNTGGQASKATPKGAVAQFAASGKKQKKKDLAAALMHYGNVYMAQVSMGANINQCIKAITEAESYDGPSVVICYAPCINHGIKGGMSNSLNEEKLAVAAGHWSLFRYDPRLAEQGKEPLIKDSGEPTKPYEDFTNNELRFR
ncbi:MAG: pyruvate:ferredoxin (flavodoxin) oxidoreductase [Lachnospiraceae bacterium]|nr:pyruvate:ferredoxin (flavodoxin) oxidoreductase [Lachnospiraceae bacterium]